MSPEQRAQASEGGARPSAAIGVASPNIKRTSPKQFHAPLSDRNEPSPLIDEAFRRADTIYSDALGAPGSTSPLEQRECDDERADGRHRGVPTPSLVTERDNVIQSLYVAELQRHRSADGAQNTELRLENFREGDFLDAIEKRVNETIARLDNGFDYEDNELNQAIVGRRLDKGVGLGGASSALGQATGDRLPPLIFPARALFPAGQIDFEGETSSDDAPSRGMIDILGDDLDRPPSTNASGGIRPYRPPLIIPSAQPDHHHGSGVPAGPMCFLRSIAKWRGSRGMQSLLRYCLTVPLVYTTLLIVAVHYLGGTMCGGDCACTAKGYLVDLLTYGLSFRLGPQCFFFAYMLHINFYAHQRHTATPALETEGTERQARQQRRKQRPAQGDSHHVPWEIPSVAYCCKQRTFLGLVALRFMFASIGTSSRGWGMPEISRTPIALASFLIPQVLLSFYMRVPELVWPVAALESYPYLVYYVQARMSTTLSADTFLLLWPFFVVLLERVLFYLFRHALPQSAPVGVRIAATTAFGFTTHASLLGVSLVVDANRSVPTTAGFVVQVALYELLLGTIVLDKLWLFVKARWTHHVLHEKVKPEDGGMMPAGATAGESPLTSASDIRCISTQTRWCSQAMAVVAVSLTFIFKQWPRESSRSIDCNGRVTHRVLSSVSFGWTVGAFATAFVLTAIIRKWHCCLRLPLTLRGVGLPLLLGLYAFATVPMALSIDYSLSGGAAVADQ